MPAARPLKFAVVPDPVIVAPLLAVTVQLPDAGSPLKATLPVAVAHVGCVIVPTVGAVGVAGWAFTTALPDAADVQPTELVTVNVYVPAASPLKFAVVPVPVIVAPLLAVTVQLPDAGSPLKATLPVAVAHVGCVIVPTVGAAGVGLTVKFVVVSTIPSVAVTCITPVVAPAGTITTI